MARRQQQAGGAAYHCRRQRRPAAAARAARTRRGQKAGQLVVIALRACPQAASTRGCSRAPSRCGSQRGGRWAARRNASCRAGRQASGQEAHRELQAAGLLEGCVRARDWAPQADGPPMRNCAGAVIRQQQRSSRGAPLELSSAASTATPGRRQAPCPAAPAPTSAHTTAWCFTPQHSHTPETAAWQTLQPIEPPNPSAAPTGRPSALSAAPQPTTAPAAPAAPAPPGSLAPRPPSPATSHGAASRSGRRLEGPAGPASER